MGKGVPSSAWVRGKNLHLRERNGIGNVNNVAAGKTVF